MRDTRYKIRDTSFAFTLVEILIVVAILGILAAIVLPEFHGHTQKAKESAAKENLRILRNAIELYAAQHNGVPPGYPNDDNTKNPAFVYFLLRMIRAEHYLSDLPRNPFNNLKIIRVLDNDEDFPTDATGSSAYIYKPAIKQIKLDWPGIDSDGTVYFNY